MTYEHMNWTLAREKKRLAQSKSHKRSEGEVKKTVCVGERKTFDRLLLDFTGITDASGPFAQRKEKRGEKRKKERKGENNSRTY